MTDLRQRMFRARVGWAVLLTVVLIAATVLRVHGIGHDSLWGDEGLTVVIAKMSIPDVVKYDVLWEQIPPVHPFIVWGWIRIFGDSEASVRMPSAIAGVAAVWMTYVLVRRLMGRRVALCAMVLLAVSPMHIAYSRECRTYATEILLGIVSVDLFVRLLRRPTQGLQAWWVVVSTLLLYSHLYGIFTILAQHVVYAIHWVRRRRRVGRPPVLPLKGWILQNVAVALLFAPWVPNVLLWTRMVAKNFWVKTVTIHDITRSYWMFSGSTGVFCVMVALVVIGIWKFRRRRGLVMLLALMLTPVVVPCVISVLTRPSYAPRYGIVAVVGWCAVAGAGLAAIRPMALRVLALLAVAFVSPLGDAAVIPRAPWRDVAMFLQKNMRSGDLAVVHLRAGSRLYNYYVDRPDVAKQFVDTASLPVSLPLENGRHIWLVIYDPWFPANAFLQRAPSLRIGRRMFTWGVLALELIEDPSATQPSTQPGTEPPPTPSTTPSLLPSYTS
jgi:4-amino-4-deoxy-L-arabinose transferase-like glycosyltransferase